jgi:two-component system, chemotaxis family, chemotaxis protein CheY
MITEGLKQCRLIGTDKEMPSILIVDDSPTIRKMIMASLKPTGAVFIEAGTGLEAVEQLMLRKFDAVTLDLNMPDMHGLELLQFLKSHNAFKDIPVLVITTHSEQMSKRVLEAGADRFIGKPFSPGELLSTMHNLLDGSRTE